MARRFPVAAEHVLPALEMICAKMCICLCCCLVENSFWHEKLAVGPQLPRAGYLVLQPGRLNQR